jgi:MFS family permease
MGAILMVSSLPAVLLAPVGGVLADRRSRRSIMIASDVLSAIALFSLGGMLWWQPEATNIILVWLFVVSLCIGIIGAFFRPAVSAAVPDVVPSQSLTAANSLVQVTYQLAVFLGQGSGGALFRILGAPILILVNGATYAIAALSTSLITIPQATAKSKPTWLGQIRQFRQDIGEGFNYVWQRRGLRDLFFVSAFLNFFTVPIVVLLPFFVEDTLRAPTDWYGYILAVYGAGSLAGYLCAGVVRLSGPARSKTLIALTITESIGYGILGLATTPAAAVGMAFLGGLAGGWVSVGITTIMQMTTPTGVRGRVFGLLGALSGSIAPIAMGLSGIVADLLGKNIPLIYMSCGVIMGCLSVAVALSRDYRRFLAYEEPSGPADIAAQPVETAGS